MKNYRIEWQIGLIALLVIIIDQVTKTAAKIYLYEAGKLQVSLVGDWFKFTYIENPGIAFGIELFSGKYAKYGLLIITIIAIIGILYYFYKIRRDNIYYKACVGFILGGAIGNLIDRTIYGQVIDFIHLDVYRGMVGDIFVAALPIFNIADVAITFAIIIIFVFQKKILDPEEVAPPFVESSSIS